MRGRPRDCQKRLSGRYDLQVIDIDQNLAKGEQIVAVPSLIKQLPRSRSEIHRQHDGPEKVLVGLGSAGEGCVIKLCHVSG